VTVALVGSALCASLQTEEVESKAAETLKRLIIELLDEAREAKEEARVAEPESRNAYRVTAGLDDDSGLGYIRDYVQVDTSSPADKACLPDKCWFEIVLSKDGEVHTDLHQMHDGSADGIIFNKLPNGEYIVKTCRIVSAEDFSVVEGRCTCNKCPLSSDMGDDYSGYMGCPKTDC